MLEIQNLSKKYRKVLAVDNVSFTVPDGKVGILLGPNGAGKSTIIKSIAGLLRYQGGVGIQKLQAKSMEAKRIFGYVPEIPSMFEALTVGEHIKYIRRAYKSDITDEEIRILTERFELDDKLDKLGNELSKGMMQKVSICCALAIKPQVILFDEPMVGLDPKAIKELKLFITELRQNGVTILISTHMLDMVKEFWDVMFIMEKGKILGSFTREDAADRDIEELFFSITGGQTS